MTVSRQAVRGILLTPDQHVLLLRIVMPGVSPFWIAPGGGVDAGETHEQALRRELFEELGIRDFEVGPLVWRRQHTFNNRNGARLCQREHYYIIEIDRFEPCMLDLIEAETLDELRWWSKAELAAAAERLTPLSLAVIVARFRKIGAPVEPPPWEVLKD